MKETEIQNILKRNVNTFINNISFELEKSHSNLFDGFGFSAFLNFQKEYYEQVYFESYLESYTRKMINNILKEILLEDVCDEFSWPELEYNGVYNGYTNKECEKEFGYEFINKTQKIGYRYTLDKDDDISELFKSEDVEKIEVIIWEKEDWSDCFEYDYPIRFISPLDWFFETLDELSEDEVNYMYNLFSEYVSNAINEASRRISLNTIPGFTTKFKNKFKSSLMLELKNEIENNISIYNIRNVKYKETETRSAQFINENRCIKIFIDNAMEKMLCGNKRFAKCFMTSEYMYKYFNDNPMLDLTPIVCDYIKSVEQLLHNICDNYRKLNHINVNMKSYTINDYIKLLKGKHKEWKNVWKNDIEDSDIIFECLNSYKKEYRNRLFHKNYINKWEDVISIRNNTIFLFVIILSSINYKYINSDMLE